MLRAFLAEFRSLHAVSDYLDGLAIANPQVSKVALVSPAAQEYLQPASPPRDPDTMAAPIHSNVALPGWKLLFHSSRRSSEITVEELTPAAEKTLQQRLDIFANAVLERHRNAMIVRLWSFPGKTEQVLACADAIASDHSFICPAIANRDSATIAFVPLTVDPPAAMHYADTISQLRSRLDTGIRLRTVACPSEVWRYLPAQSLSVVSLLVRAIKRKFNRDL